MISIRTTPLSVEEVTRDVEHPSAGAIDLFLGVVRDNSDGRVVTRLEYSAYKEMAEAEMRRIEEEIAREIPGVRLAAQHRVGDLAVGDLAVITAVSAKHRAEAFVACRLFIDRIKERVPIWKREYGPDGAYWVGWEDARCTPEGHAHAHGDAHRDHRP